MYYIFGISIEGLVIIILPLIINIFYALFPPKTAEKEGQHKVSILEILEQVTRYLMLLSFCILLSSDKSRNLVFMLIAAAFLVLYYIVRIRYFIKGRDQKWLKASFCFVPVPLAIFPVLYFLFASLSLNNYIVAFITGIFGICHCLLTSKKFV